MNVGMDVTVPGAGEVMVSAGAAVSWQAERRLASEQEGIGFRESSRQALEAARRGGAGAVDAAALVLEAAERYRKDLDARLSDELTPFLDERGRAEDAYRGAIRRIEERHKRLVRRAERDYADRVLMGVSALLRDTVAVSVGGGTEVLMNPDLGATTGDVVPATKAMAAVEEARAALAEDLNLNTRLVLEQAFLRVGAAA